MDAHGVSEALLHVSGEAEVMAEGHWVAMRLCHDSGESLTALASDCLACRRSDLAGFSWAPALRNLARTTKGFRGLILGFMQMIPLNCC